MRRPLIAAVLGASLLLASGPAAAQGLSAHQEATDRFQTGLKYYDARDFESARLAFAQAYAVLQKPSILLNLALSELYAKRPIEAIGHLEQYLAEGSAPPDKRATAKKHLEDAMKQTAHLEVKTSPGAEVRLDGRVLAATTGTVHVMPGTHGLVASQGARSKSANLELKAGESASVDLTLPAEEPKPTPAAAPAPEPSASVTTAPPAEEPSSGGWVKPTLLYGGVALVAVGAGLGVGGWLSYDAASDHEARANELRAGQGGGCATSSAACVELADEARAREDAERTGSMLATAGIVTAAVGGAAIIGSFFVRRSATREGASTNAAWSLVPIATPKATGLLLEGRF